MQKLRDPSQRLQKLYHAIREFQPAHPPNLPATQLLTNLRRARTGVAPGPSGYTSETLHLVLDDEGATSQFVAVATRIANAELLPQITQDLGLGRIVALQGQNGRVRGIVVSDPFRRLVARCLAQTYAPQIRTACKPHQFALVTRAGTEAIAHAVTPAAKSNPSTHSYRSMVSAHTVRPDEPACSKDSRLCQKLFAAFPPLASSTWPHPPTYGTIPQPHSIIQAEGGEQGDPLMPALLCWAR